MQLKVKNKLYTNRILLFLLLITVYSFITTKNDLTGDGLFSVNSLLKYGTLILCIGSEGIAYYNRRQLTERITLAKKFKNFAWYFLIILFLSAIKSIQEMHFSFRIIQTFIFVFFPMLYAFLVINTWKLEEIKFAFKVSLIISFIGYIISTGISLPEIVSNLMAINYENTDSTTLESSTFALLALGFSGYFCYFKNGYFWKILSVLFVVMTFKRQITLTAVSLLFLGFFSLRKRKVNKLYFVIACLLLIAFAFCYYYAIEPQNILNSSQLLGIDLRAFSTNRTDRLNWLSQTTFQSYGFGSSTDYMYNVFNGFALEMDTVQLYVELGPLAVIFFIIYYLKFSNENIYVLLFMVLLIVNSILSSGMASTFSWIIILIGMAAIMKTSESDVGAIEHE
ncbi:hypothetical protein [Leuconostoc citreum]|uniref:hypothetical protein n=1 Tax=Leuconostoc citreum TaxID=33964 RepID=UPI0002D5C219|nr:hypothetical protein [Leuconostoc citreum]